MKYKYYKDYAFEVFSYFAVAPNGDTYYAWDSRQGKWTDSFKEWEDHWYEEVGEVSELEVLISCGKLCD